MCTLPCSERHRVVKRQPYLLTLQLRGQSVLSNNAGSGAAAAERKVGTRFWSSQPRNRISRHRADRSEYDYRSTTEVDKTITSQIVAHNQSDKSTTKIQDPKLTSDRLRAGFPSGRDRRPIVCGVRGRVLGTEPSERMEAPPTDAHRARGVFGLPLGAPGATVTILRRRAPAGGLYPGAKPRGAGPGRLSAGARAPRARARSI